MRIFLSKSNSFESEVPFCTVRYVYRTNSLSESSPVGASHLVSNSSMLGSVISKTQEGIGAIMQQPALLRKQISSIHFSKNSSGKPRADSEGPSSREESAKSGLASSDSVARMDSVADVDAAAAASSGGDDSASTASPTDGPTITTTTAVGGGAATATAAPVSSSNTSAGSALPTTVISTTKDSPSSSSSQSHHHQHQRQHHHHRGGDKSSTSKSAAHGSHRTTDAAADIASKLEHDEKDTKADLLILERRLYPLLKELLDMGSMSTVKRNLIMFVLRSIRLIFAKEISEWMSMQSKVSFLQWIIVIKFCVIFVMIRLLF